METITAILERAQQRAREMDLPYEGALLPGEALELLQEAPGAKLVDVRSRAEWDWVGRIPGENCYNILEGFEGEKDATGHRGTRGGWKAAGLPWIQG